MLEAYARNLEAPMKALMSIWKAFFQMAETANPITLETMGKELIKDVSELKAKNSALETEANLWEASKEANLKAGKG
jgi:hypothetical protein